MDKIKAYIEVISLVSIFAGITGAMIPQGRLKNAFTAFCGAVIIFSAVNSVAELNSHGISLLDFQLQKNEQLLLSDMKTAEVTVYEDVLESAVEKKLEEYGYNTQVKAYCEGADDEIKVISFEICTESDISARSSIEAYLKNSFGDITVEFVGEYIND